MIIIKATWITKSIKRYFWMSTKYTVEWENQITVAEWYFLPTFPLPPSWREDFVSQKDCWHKQYSLDGLYVVVNINKRKVYLVGVSYQSTSLSTQDPTTSPLSPWRGNQKGELTGSRGQGRAEKTNWGTWRKVWEELLTLQQPGGRLMANAMEKVKHSHGFEMTEWSFISKVFFLVMDCTFTCFLTYQA